MDGCLATNKFVALNSRIINNDIRAAMDEHDESANFKAVSSSALFAETGNGYHVYIKEQPQVVSVYLSNTTSLIDVCVANLSWKLYGTRDHGRIIYSIHQEHRMSLP